MRQWTSYVQVINERHLVKEKNTTTGVKGIGIFKKKFFAREEELTVKKILLIGHAGFYNRGCEAIVRCTVDIIKNVIDNSSVLLSSYDPEADLAKIKEDGILIDHVIPANIKGAPRPSLSWAWQTLHRKMLYADLLKQDYLHRQHYKEANVVISIGGDNFSDDYGSPEPFFRTLDAARKYGAKTVIWGASIGPFSPIEAERKWAEYLRGVDLITVREDRTVEYLASLGVSTNVKRVSDPAFLLPAVKPKIPTPFEDSDGMKVGIGMSALMHRYQVMEQYLDASISLIEHLAAKYNGKIVLVPHVIQDKTTRNDFAVCQEITRRVSDKCQCYVLPKTLNACEMKYCISNCDYFIGARTHSTIASLSSCIPTISVGYSVKAWGINQDLLECDDYVIDMQSLSSDVLIRKFEQLREQRDKIVRRLQVSVPQAKENARRAGQYLLSTIDGDNTCRR